MDSLKDKYKKCASLMEGTPLFMRGNIDNTEDDFGGLSGPYKIALKDLRGYFREAFGSYAKDMKREGHIFFLEGMLKESDPRIGSDPDGIFTRVRVTYNSIRVANYATIEITVNPKSELGIWEEVLQKEGFYRDSTGSNGLVIFTFKASLIHVKKILSRIITIVQKRKANKARDWSLDTEEKFYANRGMIPSGECFVIKAGITEIRIYDSVEEDTQALTVTAEDHLGEVKPFYAHDAKELSDGIASILTRLWHDDVVDITAEEADRNPAEEPNLEKAAAEVKSSTGFTTPNDLGTCDFSNSKSIEGLLNQLIDHWNMELYIFEDIQDEISEIAEDVPEVVLKCIPLIMPEWSPIELTGVSEATPNANRQKRLAKIQANRAASGQFKEDSYLPRSRSLKEGLITKYNPKTGLYELRDSKYLY